MFEFYTTRYLDDLADVADGTRKEYIEKIATVPLLIIDKLPDAQTPAYRCRDLLKP